MTLAPLRDYVLCRAIPEPPRHGKIITLTAPNVAQRATVLACGPECQMVKPGETVIISRLIGQEIGDQVLVQEPYIMAWV